MQLLLLLPGCQSLVPEAASALIAAPGHSHSDLVVRPQELLPALHTRHTALSVICIVVGLCLVPQQGGVFLLLSPASNTWRLQQRLIAAPEHSCSDLIVQCKGWLPPHALSMSSTIRGYMCECCVHAHRS